MTFSVYITLVSLLQSEVGAGPASVAMTTHHIVYQIVRLSVKMYLIFIILGSEHGKSKISSFEVSIIRS